jgi:hypothetical protein
MNRFPIARLTTPNIVLAARQALFSAKLKKPPAPDLVERHRFRTQIEARLAVFDFIEGW